MEVCGGQTHAIVKYGIESMLPTGVRLLHGPGCPVCVTPQSRIDQAIELVRRPRTILCCFGDMMRVPGSLGDLQSARAAGGKVHVVYSPLDALALARKSPDYEVVFFAVGFETTAPANAMAVKLALESHTKNFSILNAHVLIPPAMAAVLNSTDGRVQGFLAAGHVCTVTGYRHYHAIADRFGVPIVVTGFEPVDILRGILKCIEMLEDGKHSVVNEYKRSVHEAGNVSALSLIADIFEIYDAEWRGLGVIPSSGMRLRDTYRAFDASEKFRLEIFSSDITACPSGEVLRGALDPRQCPYFDTSCTPERPLGPTMVSEEGACAAYYQYGNRRAAV
jgi:hydrogenase expression/formation protein HypD